MKLFQSFKIWCLDGWYGNSQSIGHLLLLLAIWDSFVAAINVTLWPRVLAPEALIYMTPTSQILPIASLLLFAAYTKVGLRATLKTYTTIGMIAFTTFLFWNPQSEAWLNRWGYKLIS